MLNQSKIWNPIDKTHAFSLVGGPDSEKHLKEINSVINPILDLIENNSTCLELGCGFGRIIKSLKTECKKEFTLYGVDFNVGMIKMAIEYCKDLDIDFRVMGDKIPVPDKSVNLIYSHAVLIHNDVHQLVKLFDEFNRICTGFMVHDIMDHNFRSSFDAIRKKFPLYCHSTEVISALAMDTGFSIQSINRTGDGRSRYMFKKL